MSVFKPKSWGAPVEYLVKEYEAQDKAERTPEVATEVDPLNQNLVRKGLLDPRTGLSRVNSKAAKGLSDQVRGYSAQGQRNYRRTFGHE